MLKFNTPPLGIEYL